MCFLKDTLNFGFGTYKDVSYKLNLLKLTLYIFNFQHILQVMIMNQSVLLRSGRISEMTLDEVRKLDIAEKHVLKDEFTPTRVPRLDDFVRECLRLDLKMIIDLKTYKAPEATARVILELFSKYPELHTKAMVSSFFPHLIYVIRFENYSSFLTKDLDQGSMPLTWYFTWLLE